MNRLSRLIATALALALLLGLTAAVSAGSVVTETLNVLYFSKNESGDGYFWNNRTDTLTLTDLTLRTKSDYGMRIPDGTTVILEGDNVIEAAKVALAVDGEVVFKGTGTLTLVGGDYGLYGYGVDESRITRYLATGTLNATGGKAAVYYPTARFYAEKGTKLVLHSDRETGFGIDGATVKLLDGTLESDAPLRASVRMTVQNARVMIGTSRSALMADRKLELKDVSVRVGGAEGELTAAESYGGEASVELIPTGRAGRTSLLFGESVPAWVDYVALIVAILLVGAAVGIPVARRAKKNKLARAKLAEALKK